MRYGSTSKYRTREAVLVTFHLVISNSQVDHGVVIDLALKNVSSSGDGIQNQLQSKSPKDRL